MISQNDAKHICSRHMQSIVLTCYGCGRMSSRWESVEADLGARLILARLKFRIALNQRNSQAQTSHVRHASRIRIFCLSCWVTTWVRVVALRTWKASKHSILPWNREARTSRKLLRSWPMIRGRWRGSPWPRWAVFSQKSLRICIWQTCRLSRFSARMKLMTKASFPLDLTESW